MSTRQSPSGDGRQDPASKSASTRAREAVGRILDATGQRTRAQEARSTLARALTTLGIKSGISTGDYLEDWRRFLRVSPTPLREPEGPDGRKRIAFVVPEGLYQPAVRDTGIIAAALRVRGADIVIVTCDKCLPACESTCVLDYEDPAAFLKSECPAPCEACDGTSKASFDAFGMPQLPLSSLSSADLREEAQETAERLSGSALEDIFGYRRNDVALGQVVETSLYRFFLLGTLSDTEEVRAVALRYMRAGVEVAGMMDQFIKTWRPDVIVSQCGLYLVGGTSMAVAESHGVERVVWDVGYRRSSLMASHNGSFVSEMRDDTSDSWDRPLSPRESQALSIYLDGRQRGAMDDMSHHPSPVEGREAVLAATGLRDGERLVSLFTNVVWDARVYAPERLFGGPVEWMVETLRQVAGTPGVRYVIRVHPAEVKIPNVLTQERMDDKIREILPDLPDGLVVIPPEDNLSTYSLAAASDLAVVYSTQMGLESMAMGIPTVVAGYPIYSGKGLGLEPPDRKSYYELLTHPGDVASMTAEEIEKARRYAFYFFFRRMVILPDIVSAVRTGLPRVRDLNDLRAGRYAGLDTICDGILSGTPFDVEDPAALESILKGTVD